MADSKSGYSSAAYFFSHLMIHQSMKAAIQYYRSKLRELKYNDAWIKNSVNLNDIVNQFTPGAKGKARGVKYEFENTKYLIKVDMPSGYLRIIDKKTGQYIKLDGQPGTLEETHFKVLKRSEM